MVIDLCCAAILNFIDVLGVNALHWPCVSIFQRNGMHMDKRKHILIVDDDGAIRGLLTASLEACGYVVSSARNGASMRALLNSRERVDAVILDCRMPGESGQSLALYAKEHGLPVVMISGSNEAMEFAERHHLQLLRKPFRMGQLYDALDLAFASHTYGQRDA